MTLFHMARSLKAIALGVCLAGGLMMPAVAQISYTVSPSSIIYTKTAVGTVSHGRNIVVTNNGTVSFTISSFSISPSVFHLADGWAPITLAPGGKEVYQIEFAPDMPKKFAGQLTVTITGVTNSIVVPLSGNGFATTAVAQITPTTLNFGPQPLGTTSDPQTVTLKNAGTSNLMVTAGSLLPPFSLSGFNGSVTLTPGQSLNVQVTYFATQPGSYQGTLMFTHDVLNPSGAALTGTAVGASSLAVTTFPVLPSATQSTAYSAVLSSAGGAGGGSWSLSAGSNLPAGLTLSPAGVISGSLAPSVAKGNYSFSVQVTDSASATAAAPFTLQVNAPTGAKCSAISTNVAGTSSPLVPIPDLGTASYLGSQGGLYPSGSNTRPATHEADGVAFANSIQPLDANGNPDPNGKYVLLAIGMSATHTLYLGFQGEVSADPTVDKTHLVLVNGAQDNATAGNFAQLNHPVWTDILSYFLPQSNVTANQVVAAWINDVSYPKGTFPGDMSILRANLEQISQNLHTKFPNIKLAYLTSRMYGGYSNNPRNPESPEPFAYESGFAVKWAIEDQINGMPALNYNPANGPVKAPWMDWGSYQWANGLTPRNDGFVWTCQDYTSDGIHPSLPPLLGRDKGEDLILNFFKTDSTTAPWFLAH